MQFSRSSRRLKDAGGYGREVFLASGRACGKAGGAKHRVSSMGGSHEHTCVLTTTLLKKALTILCDPLWGVGKTSHNLRQPRAKLKHSFYWRSARTLCPRPRRYKVAASNCFCPTSFFLERTCDRQLQHCTLGQGVRSTVRDPAETMFKFCTGRFDFGALLIRLVTCLGMRGIWGP